MNSAQRSRYINESALMANAVILAEWNLNSQSDGTTVRNHITGTTPADDYFSILSVTDVDRPSRGIIKAMTDGPGVSGAGMLSTLSQEYESGYSSYVSSLDDQYKYYLSPSRSAGATSGQGGYALADAAVEVIYSNSMPCNKILVTFETGVSIPKVVKISYRAGGSWTDVTLVNPTIDTDGRLVLWRQPGGAFSQAKTLSKTALSIDGIRVQVIESTKANAYVAVIEASPRLVVDVSDYVIDASYDAELSDSSKIAPLGVASSNTGEVTLDNTDRYFSNDNPASPFYRMINKAVTFSMYVNPTRLDESPVNEQAVVVFENMAVSSFSISDMTASIDLKDPSRILQDRKPPSMLIYPCSVVEAVIRICHSVGFSDIRLDLEDLTSSDSNESIPYFWTDSEKTAWENIAELAEATQTAVYFDESGKMNILSRSDAFNISRPVSWFFDTDEVTSQTLTKWPVRNQSDVGKKSDIIDIAMQDDEVPNDVEVKYYETKPGKINRGHPEMVVAWEPEGDVVLRSARVTQSVGINDTTATFNSSDVVTWPHSGMFQVDHEVIGYDSKEYQYYNAAGVQEKKWVSSDSDKQIADGLNPGMSWANAYTGLVRISKRGLYSTVPAVHSATKNNWYVHHRRSNGVWDNNAPSYFKKNENLGNGTLYAMDRDPASYTLLEHVLPRVGNKGIFGTRITYPEIGFRDGVAGIQIGAGPSTEGIYIEFAPTDLVEAWSRDWANELSVYWLNQGAADTRTGTGVAMQVARGVPYDIDVYYSSSQWDHRVEIYVNGEFKMATFISKASSVSQLFNAHGLYYRGAGYATFDYVYHVGANPASMESAFDSPSRFDTVKGGYFSMNSVYTAAWAPYMSQSTGDWYAPGSLAEDAIQHGQYLFLEEFGLIAHEVREFDVTYEEGPMMHSKIYLSNESQVACPSFTPHPFGAKFVLVNTSRRNAIASGEDTLTLGPENSIEQKMLIYGRKITQAEPQSAKEFNKTAAMKNGRVSLSVDNSLIQTKEHAESLARWVAFADGGGEKSISTEAYGNPHIQLGDIVAVYSEEHDLTEYIRSMFFVTGKSLKYDGGLKLDLELRSVI